MLRIAEKNLEGIDIRKTFVNADYRSAPEW
jgi:hypothetical protein